MSTAFLILAKKVEKNWDEISDLIYPRLQRDLQTCDPAHIATISDPYLREALIASAGKHLHDFYTQFEQTLVQILRQTDGGLPKGEQFRKELLEQASLDVPGVRPAVLSQGSFEFLDELRRFRHVFRHCYSYNLVFEKVWQNLQAIPELFPLLEQDVRRFVSFLERTAVPDPTQKWGNGSSPPPP